MSFSLDLKAFADKTNAKVNAAVREIVRGVDESLVEKSPVGNADLWAHAESKPKGYVGGRFRANWQYGENEIPSGELYEANNGVGYPGASDTIERAMSKVSLEAGGKHHFLANNLPYAQRLEDGWSSKQAPAGMVAITVIEFDPIVKAAVLKVNL